MKLKVNVLLLLTSVCGSLPSKSFRKIVGGNPISIEDAPYQVALMEYYKETDLEAHYCGGSLISDEFVLTAGHCILFPPLLDIKPEELRIRVGSTYYYEGGELIGVDQIILHPKWGGETFMDYDFAIVHLEFPIRYSSMARPINLPLADDVPQPGDIIFISGWGQTLDGTVDRDILRAIEIPIVESTTCNERWFENLKDEIGDSEIVITEQMICAAADADEIDACNGDSGGPAVRKSDQVLVGVVSWGDSGCVNPDFPGVYSKVSAVRDWIQEVADV